MCVKKESCQDRIGGTLLKSKTQHVDGNSRYPQVDAFRL